MKDSLWSYIAGMFDGEGTISNTPIAVTKDKASIRTATSINLHGVKYMAGFFDAEGTLCVVPRGDAERKIRDSIAFKSLEYQCLRAIQKYSKTFGIKRIYLTDTKPKEYHRKLVYILRINGKEDVKRFLELIRPYSVLKRPQIDIYLTKIYPKLRVGRGGRTSRNYTKKEFLAIMREVDRLNSLKCKCRGKYNANYFRELWGFKLKRRADRRYKMKQQE